MTTSQLLDNWLYGSRRVIYAEDGIARQVNLIGIHFSGADSACPGEVMGQIELDTPCACGSTDHAKRRPYIWAGSLELSGV